MAFICREGCSECCTVAPVYRDIWERATPLRPVKKVLEFPPMAGLRPAVLPITEDGTCALLDATGKCSIYGSRHPVCRNFGLDKENPCMYLRPDGKTRSKAETAKIRQLWIDRGEEMKRRVKG